MLNRKYSDINKYIAVTILCAIFSLIYEFFSHQVYSNFMIFLFTIPLTLGVFPELIFLIKPKMNISGKRQKMLRNFAIVSIIFGSALEGIVEIYGTTNQYIIYYFIVGVGLLFISLIMWVLAIYDKRI